MSGRMKIAHDDGTEAEIGPGDVAAIEPGHDAWIVGDETFTSVDFGGYAQYGAPKSCASNDRGARRRRPVR